MLVNGNGDLNKVKDKQKIQILLKIFREIEYNLVHVNSIISKTKYMIESDIPVIDKFQSLLSDIQERKRQVDKTVKELGTNFCY